jgi:hypothetical protein
MQLIKDKYLQLQDQVKFISKLAGQREGGNLKERAGQ